MPSAIPRFSLCRPVIVPRAGRRLAIAAVGALLAASACGKKGPPLPPLLEVPAAVSAWAAHRAGDDVFMTLTVPVANIGGDQPANVALVEVYAVTSARPPELPNGRVPVGVTLVSSASVRRPRPPVPPANANSLAMPVLPVEPGLDQGAAVGFVERLTPALRTPALGAGPTLAVRVDVDAGLRPALSLPGAFVPRAGGARRHYVAVAVSRQGKRGPWSDWRSIPVSEAPGTPGALTSTYDEQALTLAWTPAPDASLPATLPGDGTLASRPFGPAVAATRYNVYDETATTAPDTATRPAPLNDAVLATPSVTLPGLVFGIERCFTVRGIDTIDGVEVEGRASPRGCVTPKDTFAPAAPTALEAVAGGGVISLIWEAVATPDLAGYLVFRGPAPDEPVTQLTPSPIGATSFEDRTVTAGVRYVYVVVAVDSATPVNRSARSNRAEETARQ